MEKAGRFETVELLTTNVAQNSADPVYGREDNAESFSLTKRWYQQSFQLSGENHVRLVQDNSATGVKSGWRLGSFISCVFVGAVLFFNTGFVVYAIRNNPPSGDGVGKLKRGPCQQILSTSTWSHVVINVCSTILVAASNYNMQCSTAPTRKETNEAHKMKQHMEIGVQSVKNLFKIPKWKGFLWLALLLSTLPLHFLWNSAIFAVTAINQYSGIVVMPNFLDSTKIGLDCSERAMSQYQLSSLGNSTGSEVENYATCWLLSEARAGRLTKMSSSDCIKGYSLKLVTSNYNLIVVTNSSSLPSSYSFPAKASRPVLAYFDSISYPSKVRSWCQQQCPQSWCTPWRKTSDPCRSRYSSYPSFETNSSSWCSADNWDSSNATLACYQYATNGTMPTETQGPSDWTCNTDDVYTGHCSVSNALKHSSQWTILPERYPINHCLVSDHSSECELQYSSFIFYAVLICNAIKFVVILLHLSFAREPIFATVGDAVASFLKEPDMNTKRNCLYTNNNQQFDYYQRARRWDGPSDWTPRIWKNNPKKRLHWAEGASLSQLAICCCIWVAILGLTAVYFQQGRYLTGSQKILDAGFGTMNIAALVGTSVYKGASTASILTTSLLVNTPQVIFSSLYFMYNSIYTCMASAYEWSLFGHHRKGLRVTAPSGSQRSSYWLQLPWKFSLPLIASSALLHWLVSQSILMVNVQVQKSTNQPLTSPDQYFPMVSDRGTITAMSFSPLAIIFAITVSSLMLVCLLVICFLLLKPGIPLVGSNSFAISAACHAHPDDVDAATKPLLWGAVQHQNGQRPGHCCFTSFVVDEPRVGDMYA